MNLVHKRGSLSESQKQKKLTFAEAFLSVDALLIVDISISMSTEDIPVEGGLAMRSRWEEANIQLENLQRKFPGRLAVVAFSTRAEFCPTGVLPGANGGTNLTGALEFVAPADGCGIKFIVASDGEPDNAQSALAFAKTLTNKIDTIHIGNSERGRKFLEELAHASGGQAMDKSVSLLEEAVTLLLKG